MNWLKLEKKVPDFVKRVLEELERVGAEREEELEKK